METKLPIIVALDTPNIDAAFNLANSIKNQISAVKLGLEFFTNNGPEGVLKFTENNIPVFLDLKFHDIPNTVYKAVYEATKLNIDMLTIHTSGGIEMLKKAKEAAFEASEKYKTKIPAILGVTILTSLDDDDLNQIGYKHNSLEQVTNLFKLAEEASLAGIVCSAHELSHLKKINNNALKFVVPGIRTEEEILNKNNIGDQKRVLTPKQAIDNGADYLVIGRSITNSDNPSQKLDEIATSLS